MQASEDTFIGVLSRPVRLPRRRWVRYGVAVVCVGVAALLERWLGPTLGALPMVLYFPAVLIAAWYGGLGPGLLATALSLAAPDLLRASSPFVAAIDDPLDTMRGAMFGIVGIIASWLNELVYRQRVQLEAAVADAQESERRFRLTADYAPMMVWMAGDDLEYDWVNKRWLEYRGRSLDEELGSGWRDGIHPEDRERCAAEQRAALAERRPYSIEYRLERHDGEFRWMLDQGVPRLGNGGGFSGYIGCCLDVESIKRAQAENERLLEVAETAREEADAASRAKDIFLATVSHELRNPLNAIVGWAHILRSEGASPAEVKQGADIIAQSAQMQVRLIEELLDVSRIITGTMRLNRQPADLAAIVRAAAESLRPVAAAKDLTLDVDTDEVPTFSGDPDRLRQVVINLVSNAINYTPRGGRVEVTLREASDALVLVVADTGIGIAAEFLPHVFEAFRQSDSATRRSHRGLGIGLSVVRHLVQMHGGRVSASSAGPGHGSEFTVRLPRPVAAAAAAAETTPSGALDGRSPWLRGKRVLVVDDDSAALQLVEKLLSDCEAVVLTAGSVREAMKALPRFRPDLVVSDIQMPGADGYELIRQLRQLPADQGGSTPAAALTAFASEGDRRAVLAAGFQLHLTKPVAPQTLLEELARLGRS